MLTASETKRETRKRKKSMKETCFIIAMRNGAKRIPIGLGVALALSFLHQNASADEVLLGTANGYSVLAGSSITSTGLTVINGGSIGVSPGTAITGFPPGIVIAPGTIQSATAAAAQGESDLTTAYNQAAGLARTATLTGLTLGTVGTETDPLTPGVYFFKTSAQLTGTLYLNDEGEKDPIFVFQIGSTLTTASDSAVVELNQGSGTIKGSSIFWQVGTSATLGTGTSFDGNILANASITDDGGSTVYGRLLAMTSAVTLNDTIIDTPPAEVAGGGGGSGGVPDTGSTLLLLGSGLTALFAFGRRCFGVLR
jgi:hypothetical protein